MYLNGRTVTRVLWVKLFVKLHDTVIHDRYDFLRIRDHLADEIARRRKGVQMSGIQTHVINLGQVNLLQQSRVHSIIKRRVQIFGPFTQTQMVQGEFPQKSIE